MTYIKLNARMASLVLVIGIFFALSCAGTTTLDQDNNTTTSLEQYERMLDDINSKLTESPENSNLRLEKAQILDNLAKAYSNPQQRKPLYQNIRELTDSPNTTTSLRNNELKDLLVHSWSREQSEGVKLLQIEEESNNNHFNAIVAHFDNAITLMPDSTVSYSLLATTYYQNGYLKEAIEKLQTVEEKSDVNQSEIREKLAYLHLESGEIEQSIDLYRQLVEDHPDDAHLRHGLANAYMINKQHQDTIVQLRILTEQFPTRYNYFESLATELYFTLRKEIDNTISGDADLNSNELITRINNHIEEIDNIFDTFTTRLPQNEESLFRMASFYLGISSKLADLDNILDSESKNSLNHSPEEMLESSLTFWERLIELNPDNPEYINNLYLVYMNLNMEEEAQSLERSFNF